MDTVVSWMVMITHLLGLFGLIGWGIVLVLAGYPITGLLVVLWAGLWSGIAIHQISNDPVFATAAV